MARSTVGQTVLHTAAKKPNLPMVELLLQKGADVSLECLGECKETALQLAAERSNLEMLKVLLKHENQVDKRRESSFRGSVQGSKVLKKGHCDSQTNRNKALAMAVEKDAVQCVDELIKVASDVTEPLFLASTVEMFMKLLESPVFEWNRDYRSPSGETLLHKIVNLGLSNFSDEDMQRIRERVDLNSMVNTPDEDNATPLMTEIQQGDLKGIEELIKMGCDPGEALSNFLGTDYTHHFTDSDKDSWFEILLNLFPLSAPH